MKTKNTLIAVNLSLLTLGAFVYVLYIGAPIIIPFVIAVLLSFMILSIASFFRHRGLQRHLAFIMSLFSIGLVLFIITKIINSNVTGIIHEAPVYQEKLTQIIFEIAEKYNINQKVAIDQIIGAINIPSIVSGTATIITSFVKNAGLILFFTIFILLESTSFFDKLKIITGGEKSSFFKIFEQIQGDMKSYFMIKTFTSLCISIISAIIMYFFGLDFFIFWAFLILLLNYIPSIGSIIAVCFPVVFSLIQFESLYLTTVLLILMIIAQVFIGNFLEPRLMGNKLNLSPLVILVSLIFWGMVWGPTGMLLSVPIMVMINIVLAHIEVTRPIAILLSEKGIVKFNSPKGRGKKTYSLAKMRRLLKSSKK